MEGEGGGEGGRQEEESDGREGSFEPSRKKGESGRALSLGREGGREGEAGFESHRNPVVDIKRLNLRARRGGVFAVWAPSLSSLTEVKEETRGDEKWEGGEKERGSPGSEAAGFASACVRAGAGKRREKGEEIEERDVSEGTGAARQQEEEAAG